MANSTVEASSTLESDESAADAVTSVVGPRLVLSTQCDRLDIEPQAFSLKRVDELSIGRGEGTFARPEGPGAIVLSVQDAWMSSEHACVVRRDGAFWLEDCESRNGTRIGGALVEQPVRLVDGAVIEIGKSMFVFRSGERANVGRGKLPDGFDAEFSTCNRELLARLELLRRVAKTDLSVLVLGESGTGKEVAASVLHRNSGRTGAFVAVNCGALPAGLVESELFGRCKGAFTGATDTPGLVQRADGGTLFLDEIADLPLEAQVKLLRVLQEREVTPVGGTRPTPVDLRVVSATCRNLESLVQEKMFRIDLFARISGHTLRLCPLRERLEDLGALMHVLLKRRVGAAASGFRVERRALRALYAHHWPLNIRELDNALKLALALVDGSEITLESLPETIQIARAPVLTSAPATVGFERAQLVELLERHQGNLSAIEREVSRSRPTLRKWCRRFSLNVEDYRPRP